MIEPLTLRMFICLLTLILGAAVLVRATPVSELYFSNQQDIMRLLTDGSSTIVISDPKLVDAIDCNICDRMIYWVDQPGVIKRADPFNHSSVQVIIEDDLDYPKGLAVDWRGNNIYFSHGSGDQGRIEVASHNGRQRRVLVHDIALVGPVAVNVDTGYLFYSHSISRISRLWLNGKNEELLFIDLSNPFNDIVGLEVDLNRNRLYWTQENNKGIRYLELNTLEQDVDSRTSQLIRTNESYPHELTVHNNTLYWTQKNDFNPFTQLGTRPGAVYALDIVTHTVSLLIHNNTLSPHDVCYFYDVTMPPSGCALGNGGCDSFCFTVPDVVGGGTRVDCACSTGILLSQEGTCPIYPHNFLLFTQEHSTEPSLVEVNRTDIRIISLDIPGKLVDVLTPISVPGTSAKFLAYDITKHEVYWSQLEPPRIMRAVLDGSGEKILIQTSLSLPESLAVDPYSGNLYWVDSNLDKIEVYGLESRHRKVLVNTGLKPQGLALDLRNRYIYWTDLEQSRPRVERCHLDGSGREEILPHLSAYIRQPGTITVDPITGWVYWAEVERDKLFHFTGTNDESVQLGDVEFSVTGMSDVSSLAVHGEFLYWADRSGNHASISRVNKKNGRNAETVSTVGGVYGLLAANQSTETIHAQCTMCDQLCLPSNDPSNPTCACADNLIANSQGGCDDPLPMMFVAAVSSLSESSPSVSSLFRVDFVDNYYWEQNMSVVSLLTNVSSMDFDYTGNMLYWIDPDDHLIYRTPTNEPSLSREKVISCCVGAPADLAVDWFGRNLYWTDSTRRIIEVTKLDGSRRTTLYKVPTGMGAPTLIVLDPLRGQLYWTPQSAAIIYRMNMDGNESSVHEFWRSTEVYGEVFGMAMNYTMDAGVMDQLYWGASTIDTSNYYAKLFAMSVDSDNSATESFDGLNSMVYGQGVKLVVYDGDYYVQTTTNSGPFIGNIEHDSHAHNFNEVLNGVLDDHSTFFAFSIVHHSIQPGQHECSVLNKGCGGSAVCLVKSGVRGECVCPPLQAGKYARGPDGVSHLTCAPTDTFLLIATEDSIYHLPVPDVESSTSEVQAIPVGVVGQIETLAYDPNKKNVLYTDSSTRFLHSVALDSSSETSIPLVGDLRPSSLAYDWVGGHIFATERIGFQIELMTVNGEGVGSVLDFDVDQKYQLNILGDVVFDSDRSTLYWTYNSPKDNLGVELHYMTLHDMVDTKIDLGYSRIEKLTLDSLSHTLYWINGTDPSSIEKYNSTTRRIDTVVRNATGIVALAAVQVGTQPYLFWYNNNKKMIYRHDGTRTEEYRSWNPGNVSIVAMVGHRQSAALISLPCLESPRPCSHYCLKQPISSYQCACPMSRELINGNTCSSSNCSSVLRSCGDVYDECYPRTYWCDNIPHCRNGADEMCGCSNDSFGCYINSTCVPMSTKCDGVTDCPDGEDELDCCEDDTFGCYVEDDTPDSLGGGRDLRYRCLLPQLMCDVAKDCYNGTDEPDSCPTSAPTTPTPSSGASRTVIILVVLVVSIFLVGSVLVCCCIFLVAKKKQENIASNAMTRAFNLNLNHKPDSRGDSQSGYYSDFSNGTITTQLGNGSNVSSSQNGGLFNKRSSGLSTDPSNPPPSPMTMRHSRFSTALTDIEDDQSVFSEHMSEYPVPPPPNPSLNYDVDIVSDNLSYSVSQNRFPATISGRAHNNSLLMQQYRQYNYPHYNNGGHPPTPQRNQWSSNGGISFQHNGDNSVDPQHTNGKYPYSSTNSYHHHFPPAHPRKELDSLARTETESTISITTVSTENHDDYHYEDMMSCPPPGRPPSPVTVVSEYPPPAPPMSPDSTLSELSEDECSERHLQQT